MLEKLSRSFDLIYASAALLKHDRRLLVFPLLSSLAALLVLTGVILPLYVMNVIDGITRGNGPDLNNRDYLIGFLFYFIEYFIIFFFNVALVSCVMLRMDGGRPTVAYGLRVAASKAHVILGYAFIAATVGMILRAIGERVGFVGRLIVALMGAAWTMATYLVVPVLVANDVGPLTAVGDSIELLKRTWGESVIGQFGIGLGFFVIYLVIGTVGAIFVGIACAIHSPVIIALAALTLIIAVMLAILVHSALGGIYSAVLYRFATAGEGTPGFDQGVLQDAFAPKAGS